MWRAVVSGYVSIVHEKCCVFPDLCQNFGISVKSALHNHTAITFYQPHRDKTTAKNTIISPDFLVWKFCGKAQFPHGFGRSARNSAETVPFRKISTPGNQVKLWYFSQCYNV